MDWWLIVGAIVVFITGLIIPSPFSKKIVKIGFACAKLGMELFASLKEDSASGFKITKEEMEKIKGAWTELMDILYGRV